MAPTIASSVNDWKPDSGTVPSPATRKLLLIVWKTTFDADYRTGAGRKQKPRVCWPRLLQIRWTGLALQPRICSWSSGGCAALLLAGKPQAGAAPARDQIVLYRWSQRQVADEALLPQIWRWMNGYDVSAKWVPWRFIGASRRQAFFTVMNKAGWLGK